MNLDSLKWDERGLIPVIVQDTTTKQVLMMAWMNAAGFDDGVDECRIVALDSGPW